MLDIYRQAGVGSTAWPAEQTPPDEWIRENIRNWPDLVLDTIAAIYIYPQNDPLFPTNVEKGTRIMGRYWGGSQIIGMREDAFWKARTGEFGGFILNHEVAHHYVNTVWGTSGPWPKEDDPYGYTPAVERKLKDIYRSNGLSDLGPAEDIAEAVHEYIAAAKDLSRRGRNCLDDDEVVAMLERSLDGAVTWDEVRSVPIPPWAPPELDRVSTVLDAARIEDVRRLDGGETMVRWHQELIALRSDLSRLEYWMGRSLYPGVHE